ncbi:sulfur oxidation c-type cytochrome SoxX [Alicycliphilus denitrificans]|uniref:Sulfur oxidation c-type cytochrome SoxX n=1 Tax=Alicycliphilus denitrificans TaxID=179636 RepID=A0A3R7ISG0_9BURK|nr:sulfur oxidation c-type cytochrome SoxX [Alicycliphilus denitrificans]RKJ95698.1 sulfur oxidation c-type cytochrome SoxX [Alicycliphilus denitrificans]
MHSRTTLVALPVVLAAAALASCAGGFSGPGTPSAAEIDALTQQIVAQSFHDKGIVKVQQAFAEDETLRACNAADVAGRPLDAETAKRIEALNMQTVKWPADGKYLGDWKAGEALAQSGRGMTWTDTAKTPNGGNCYNCHQIDKKEISFGTIGPSLYHYGKLRGVSDPNAPESREVVRYTWGKIWNSKAYAACSNMPRAGHKGILNEKQVADLVALLLDPASPVNK